MKIPPVVQIFIAAGLAWAVTRTVPVWNIENGLVRGAVWITGLIGLGFLAVALKSFRDHETTFDPLDPAKAQHLVTTGIYRITRNPMYVGLLFLLLAWCLMLGDVSALVALPVFVGVMNRLQIKSEEQALLHKFGAEYAAYCGRVRRWL